MNIQEARDWVDNLRGDFHAVTDLWIYTGDFDLYPGDTVGARYLERESEVIVDLDKSNAFFEMPNCTHGDYIGDTVTMANFNVLTSEGFLEDNDLPAHIVGIGGFGSQSLFYSLCTATQTQLDNLKEIVEDLVDYPVVDEDAWTKLESEIIDNDICQELSREVEREIYNMDRDDVVAWYDEGAGENITDALFDIIHYESAGEYIEVYVEGINNVVYGEDYKWFAQKVIERFEEVRNVDIRKD